MLCVQFDDQKIVSGSYDDTIKVWSLELGTCLNTLVGHADAVTCLQFNYHRIISGSLDCTLRFWDMNEGNVSGDLNLKIIPQAVGETFLVSRESGRPMESRLSVRTYVRVF